MMLSNARTIVLIASSILFANSGQAGEVVLRLGESLDYGVDLNGANYFSLHRDAAKQWRLTPVQIQVTQVDPDVVTISSPQENTLFLLQHSTLRSGPVRVATVVDWSYQQSAKPNDVVTRYLHEIGDVVSVKLDTHIARLMIKENELTLEVDGVMSTLLSAMQGYYSLDMWWAGDLDGDNKIDWLLERSDDKASHLCLYLSSIAKEGQFVGEAGCMMSSG